MKNRNLRCRPIQSMRNDLTKTMDMTIWPVLYQNGVFSRKYIIGAAPSSSKKKYFERKSNVFSQLRSTFMYVIAGIPQGRHAPSTKATLLSWLCFSTGVGTASMRSAYVVDLMAVLIVASPSIYAARHGCCKS